MPRSFFLYVCCFNMPHIENDYCFGVSANRCTPQMPTKITRHAMTLVTEKLCGSTQKPAVVETTVMTLEKTVERVSGR